MRIFLLFVCNFAVLSTAFTTQFLDSATQGPNPQDIATPEPEYIDIDEPLSDKLSTSGPQQALVPVALHSHSVNTYITSRSQPRLQQNYVTPKLSMQHYSHVNAGHAFNSQSGYNYRHPVVYKQIFRRFV